MREEERTVKRREFDARDAAGKVHRVSEEHTEVRFWEKMRDAWSPWQPGRVWYAVGTIDVNLQEDGTLVGVENPAFRLTPI